LEHKFGQSVLVKVDATEFCAGNKTVVAASGGTVVNLLAYKFYLCADGELPVNVAAFRVATLGLRPPSRYLSAAAVRNHPRS
jgi:hypothetical protein